jgi:hypothetical protein
MDVANATRMITYIRTLRGNNASLMLQSEVQNVSGRKKMLTKVKSVTFSVFVSRFLSWGKV